MTDESYRRGGLGEVEVTIAGQPVGRWEPRPDVEIPPFRVEWRATLSEHWVLLKNVGTREEANDLARGALDEYSSGYCRIVEQRVVASSRTPQESPTDHPPDPPVRHGKPVSPPEEIAMLIELRFGANGAQFPGAAELYAARDKIVRWRQEEAAREESRRDPVRAALHEAVCLVESCGIKGPQIERWRALLDGEESA